MTFCRNRRTVGWLGAYLCLLPCGFQVIGGLSAEANESSVVSDRILVLAHDHSWRFESPGTDLGLDGRAQEYDDRTWSSGPVAFGWEDPAPAWPINTWLTLDAIPTFYFRTTFRFTEDPAAFELVFTHLIDDGAVFYLNGQEIFRLGMNPGDVEFGTLATRFVDAATFEVTPISSQFLQSGTNVLAVEVHQNATTGQDLVFGTSLTAARLPVEPLSIIAQPQSQIVENGRTAEFSVEVSGQPAHYQWFHDGIPLPDSNQSHLVLPNVSVMDEGSYTVRVPNEQRDLSSLPAGLRVTLDTNPPSLLQAQKRPDLQHINVVFSEPLDAVSAIQLAHYMLTANFKSEAPH